MDRLLIVGCCGAGKSTLSYRIKSVLGHELIHLDQYYWKPNWVETPKKEWEAIVTDLIAKDQWIMDGNYGGTLDMRISRSDTIVYLDASTFKCLYRVTKRILKYHGTTRPDMTSGCPERFDLEFLHYVASYNIRKRKSLLSKFQQLSTSKRVFILKSEKDIQNFLNTLKSA